MPFFNSEIASNSFLVINSICFPTLRVVMIDMAITAVIKSTKNETSTENIVRSTPPAAGERSVINDCMLPFIPFTFINLSPGTNCGKIALTAEIESPNQLNGLRKQQI